MSDVFRRIFYFLTLLAVGHTAQAQGVAYGDWQLHLPANRPLRLADTGERLYVATESAFYFLDKALNTTQVLSQRDGLSDVGVAGLDYDPVTRQLVVVYKSTNIDIIRPDGKVRNMTDILRKTISGDRGINEVRVAGDRAYLATDFGLVVLNLNKLEITDTYTNIGANGASVRVYSTAVTNDTLFASTSAGVLRARISPAVNLLDYRNWVLGPQPSGNSRHQLAVYNARVFAAEGAYGGLYVYSARTNATAGGTWQYIDYVNAIRDLRPTTNGLIMVDDGYDTKLITYQNGRFKSDILFTTAVAGKRTLAALLASNGRYYVADYDQGLMSIQPGTPPVVEHFRPNGPASAAAFNILTDSRSGIVDVFAGQYNDRHFQEGRAGEFYQYQNGQWTNYTRTTLPSATDFPVMRDFVRGARTPDGTLYVASYGDGLLQWKGTSDFQQFNQNTPNSPLLPFDTGEACLIGDVASDAAGNVWLTNRHLKPGISGVFMLNPNATPPTWTSTPFLEGLQIPDRLVLDDNGFVWVSVARKTDGTRATPGVIVIDPSLNNPVPRYFSSANGLPNNEIYDLVKDRSGDIWAATLSGVAVLNGPGGAFDTGAIFRAPLVTRGEGQGFVALLDEKVTTIAVDGANRKWFGTDKNGLWLFSADGNEALLHFTTENSPLPSNRIVDVAVDDKTGTVWVATDAGVVSYRGSATVTEGSPNCTKVSPNPVRPDFAGTVGISGLANNALVKITDVAGHLVYATTATGGTLTWNMNDATGKRVRSGVYLVLSSDADGGNTCVSKVAVLSK